eukprot:6181537-Pleurochrysis_carterae.AAC.2
MPDAQEEHADGRVPLVPRKMRLALERDLVRRHARHAQRLRIEPRRTRVQHVESVLLAHPVGRDAVSLASSRRRHHCRRLALARQVERKLAVLHERRAQPLHKKQQQPALARLEQEAAAHVERAVLRDPERAEAVAAAAERARVLEQRRRLHAHGHQPCALELARAHVRLAVARGVLEQLVQQVAVEARLLDLRVAPPHLVRFDTNSDDQPRRLLRSGERCPGPRFRARPNDDDHVGRVHARRRHAAAELALVQVYPHRSDARPQAVVEASALSLVRARAQRARRHLWRLLREARRR